MQIVCIDFHGNITNEIIVKVNKPLKTIQWHFKHRKEKICRSIKQESYRIDCARTYWHFVYLLLQWIFLDSFSSFPFTKFAFHYYFFLCWSLRSVFLWKTRKSKSTREKYKNNTIEWIKNLMKWFAYKMLFFLDFGIVPVDV